MNLIELKTFLTVIEEKGISAAALKLNVTQPAVTKRLENLKHSFNIKTLFTRKQGEFKISKEAKVLFPYAQNVIALSENAKFELSQFISGNKGDLNIGCGTIWSMTEFPEAIAKTLKKYPDLEITVKFDDPDILIQDLSKNKIDILFARKPSDTLHFDFFHVRKDNFLFYVSKDHILAHKKVLLSELANYKWVMNSSSNKTKSIFYNIFSALNLKKPSVCLNTNSPRMGFRVVEKSNFILFTSSPSKVVETFDLIQLDIIDFNEIKRESGIVTRKAYQSAVLNSLLEDLKTSS
jgi:DNA-binding transcriptional LysR family regulator